MFTKCECGLKYPKSLGQCPRCDGPPERKPLTVKESIESLTDTEVKFIFQNGFWTQGTKEARQLCLAEYDERIGLENWPAHISKEI